MDLRNHSALPVVAMMLGSWRSVVTPELLITGDLIRVERRARFEMRRQMHRPQSTLQFGNCRRRAGEAIRRNLTFGKELVEGLFLRYQLAPERLGGGAHALENSPHLALLCFR